MSIKQNASMCCQNATSIVLQTFQTVMQPFCSPLMGLLVAMRGHDSYLTVVDISTTDSLQRRPGEHAVASDTLLEQVQTIQVQANLVLHSYRASEASHAIPVSLCSFAHRRLAEQG